MGKIHATRMSCNGIAVMPAKAGI